MDELNIETRQPASCPMCGEEHLECSQAILDGMALMLWTEARRRLSPQGMEALRMLDYGVNELGVREAMEEARQFENLPEGEVDTILVYLARKTLIDAACEELYKPEE